MKKIILLSVLFLSFLSAQAQFDFGIRAGVNFPNASFDDFKGNTNYEDVASGDRELGYHAGVFARIKLVVLHVQPELIFTHISHTAKAKAANGDESDIDISFNRIDIPLLVGKAFGPVNVKVGPVISFNVGEQSDVLENGLQNGSWGYQLGAGLDIGKFNLELRYEGPLSRTAEALRIDGENFQTDTRINQIIVGIGYELF